MRGDGAAIQQAGRGQHEGAGTHAARARRAGVAAAQPGHRFGMGAGVVRAGAAWHQQHVDGRVAVLFEGAVHLHAQALFPRADDRRGGDRAQLVERLPRLFVGGAEGLPGARQIQRLESVVQHEHHAPWRGLAAFWRTGGGASAYAGRWRF
ncbi:hypothetical protein D3C87_1457350 [compost metagenome]